MLLLLSSVGFQQLASAGGDRPPRTRLIVGDRGQTGRLGSYCWDNLCADVIGFPLPRATRVPADRDAVIRIRGRGQPDSVDLWGWRRVREDEFGTVRSVGRPRVFRTGLRRILRDGERHGWAVLFSLPEREGDLYLDLFVRWQRGDASYGFHLDLR